VYQLQASLRADADAETITSTPNGPSTSYRARFVAGNKYGNEFEDPFDVDDPEAQPQEEMKTPTPGAFIGGEEPEDDDEESKESQERASFREEAILDLMKEKDKVYEDLKQSLGQTEADAQIKIYMKNTYKKKFEKIDKHYKAQVKAAK